MKKLTDVFWENISKIISNKENNSFKFLTIKEISGGDISRAFSLSGSSKRNSVTNKKSYFIKTNNLSQLGMFQSEAVGLKEISDSNSIKTPTVIDVNYFDGVSFIILENLELRKQGSMESFATSLAKMHNKINSDYGFIENNFIGLTTQINSKKSNWNEFYLNHRISVQINFLNKKFNLKKLKNNFKILQQNFEKLFTGYKPKASLLHGDLWQGNYAFVEDGQPVIYDPACYYGDHEIDLAMLELFGNPGKQFFETYHQHFPIHQGYEKRKTLYNLYHILNHANLFGGGYLSQAETMMEQIIDSV